MSFVLFCFCFVLFFCFVFVLLLFCFLFLFLFCFVLFFFLFCQTDNPRFSFIMLVTDKFNLFILVENSLDEIWKLVNSVSYVSQQRGSP